jgi:hypothetical protein
MNWDDPAERAALIERIGVDAYNRQHAEHMKSQVRETVNGYDIAAVNTRFGRLFAVRGTDAAFSTLTDAQNHARKLPPRVTS